MTDAKQATTYLRDYRPTPYLIDSVQLHFDLQLQQTRVTARLQVRRNPQGDLADNTLLLNGEAMQLVRLLINGTTVVESDYVVSPDNLLLKNLPENFTLETEVIINPEANKALNGLYLSQGNYCTQCEAQGFRRITYFYDRPDSRAVFTTTIIADKTRYPVLLANGNVVSKKALANNKHQVQWHDPTKKPAYLFALVAGDYEQIADHFVTCSGRHVDLHFYVEKGKSHQTEHAVASLKRAMKWDEDVYHREYDLDVYMIVAVSDFNMGAMENKGLNIFNDRYILATKETATDDDFIAIESVVAHEYFHNWSGNRVSVRDWFQITLKEGLTIFRDQQFTADRTSPAVKRIKDVNFMRTVQFLEEASPMAHPIRPDHYREVNNFYTATVYHKGAEVIRMHYILLGKERFHQAMDVYFSRFDGQAVTTEDFVNTMEEVSQLDLTQFRLWYSQVGTPRLTVTDSYDAAKHTYSLTVTQSCPAATPPLQIPFVVGLLDESGSELPLVADSASADAVAYGRVILLTKKQQTITFTAVPVKPVPSLLRGFSAPVTVDFPYTEAQLLFLMARDSDPVNRWDAGQKLLIRQLQNSLVTKQQQPVSAALIAAFAAILADTTLDNSFKAELLVLPRVNFLMQVLASTDVLAIHAAHQHLRQQLALALKEPLLTSYHQLAAAGAYQFTGQAVAQRRLKNTVLYYLASLQTPEIIQLCQQQYAQADTMTDTMGALEAINDSPIPQRQQLIDDFYLRWQSNHLVVDKWLMLQARSTLPTTLTTVQSLVQHPAFTIDNPNKVYSLIRTYCSENPVCFYGDEGASFIFLADQVVRIDSINPQVAARILEPLTRWRDFSVAQQTKMRTQLQRISDVPQLSNDVCEIVQKSLGTEKQ